MPMGRFAISDCGFRIAEFKSRCRIVSLPARRNLRAFAVLLHFKAYFNVRACNCKRAVERSTRLELLDETVSLLSRNAIQKQIESSAVENHYICAHRMLAIDPAFDLRAHGSQGNCLIARNHVKEFHATRGNASQEYFRWRYRLARTAILYRAIDDKILIARRTQDAPKGVSASRLNAEST